MSSAEDEVARKGEAEAEAERVRQETLADAQRQEEQARKIEGRE